MNYTDIVSSVNSSQYIKLINLLKRCYDPEQIKLAFNTEYDALQELNELMKDIIYCKKLTVYIIENQEFIEATTGMRITGEEIEQREISHNEIKESIIELEKYEKIIQTRLNILESNIIS